MAFDPLFFLIPFVAFYASLGCELFRTVPWDCYPAVIGIRLFLFRFPDFPKKLTVNDLVMAQMCLLFLKEG